MINFSKKSFHFRFHQFYESFACEEAPSIYAKEIKNLCPYFWLTIFRFLFLPIAVLAKVLMTPIPKTPYINREFNNIRIERLTVPEKIEASVILAFFGILGGFVFCLIFLSPFICLFTWIMTGYFGSLAPAAIIGVCIYAIIAICMILSRDLVCNFIYASYKRVCPGIKFSD